MPDRHEEYVIAHAKMWQVRTIMQTVGGFHIDELDTVESIVNNIIEEYGIVRTVAWLELLQLLHDLEPTN